MAALLPCRLPRQPGRCEKEIGVVAKWRVLQKSERFILLETVLKTAGFTLADVTRLNYYTTDVDKFFESHDIVANRLSRAGSQPSGTLLGVTRLAFPGLLIEIEATAVK